MFSGGIGSFWAAMRVSEEYGVDDLTLLFADTRMEDEDLYRFLYDGARHVLDNRMDKLVIIRDGRTPWDVFLTRSFLEIAVLILVQKFLNDRFLRNGWNVIATKVTLYYMLELTGQRNIDLFACETG